MNDAHDAVPDPGPRTPVWFVLAACALLLGLLSQFLVAGIALFRDGAAWGLHGAVGGAISVPIIVLLGGAVIVPRLRGFAGWTGLACALYLIQIALAAGADPLRLSLHPVNGALLLTTSLVLLGQVARHRARRARGHAGSPPEAALR